MPLVETGVVRQLRDKIDRLESRVDEARIAVNKAHEALFSKSGTRRQYEEATNRYRELKAILDHERLYLDRLIASEQTGGTDKESF